MELLQNLMFDCLIDYLDEGWVNYGLRTPVRFAKGSNK